MKCGIDCSRAFQCHNAVTKFNGLVRAVHDNLARGDVNSAIRALDELSEEVVVINKQITGR